MGHRLRGKTVRQTPRFKKAADARPMRMADGLEQCPAITQRLATQHAQIRLERRRPVASERDPRHYRTYLSNTRVGRLAGLTGRSVIHRENAQRHLEPLERHHLVHNKCLGKLRPRLDDVADSTLALGLGDLHLHWPGSGRGFPLIYRMLFAGLYRKAHVSGQYRSPSSREGATVRSRWELPRMFHEGSLAVVNQYWFSLRANTEFRRLVCDPIFRFGRIVSCASPATF